MSLTQRLGLKDKSEEKVGECDKESLTDRCLYYKKNLDSLTSCFNYFKAQNRRIRTKDSAWRDLICRVIVWTKSQHCLQSKTPVVCKKRKKSHPRLIFFFVVGNFCRTILPSFLDHFNIQHPVSDPSESITRKPHHILFQITSSKWKFGFLTLAIWPLMNHGKNAHPNMTPKRETTAPVMASLWGNCSAILIFIFYKNTLYHHVGRFLCFSE